MKTLGIASRRDDDPGWCTDDDRGGPAAEFVVALCTSRPAALAASGLVGATLGLPFDLLRIENGKTQLWPGDRALERHSGVLRCVFRPRGPLLDRCAALDRCTGPR